MTCDDTRLAFYLAGDGGGLHAAGHAVGSPFARRNKPPADGRTDSGRRTTGSNLPLASQGLKVRAPAVIPRSKSTGVIFSRKGAAFPSLTDPPWPP